MPTWNVTDNLLNTASKGNVDPSEFNISSLIRRQLLIIKYVESIGKIDKNVGGDPEGNTLRFFGLSVNKSMCPSKLLTRLVRNIITVFER